MHRERIAAFRRSASGWTVAVGKVVDQLLDPNGVWRRQLSVYQKLADFRVACGVDVDGKSRQRRDGGRTEIRLGNRIKGVGVPTVGRNRHLVLPSADRMPCSSKRWC